MRKYSIVLFLFVFLFVFNVEVFGKSIYSIDTLNNMSIKVASSNIGVKSKIIVEKDQQKYYYNLKNAEETIPLQLGQGKYIIKVAENISGNRYKIIETKEVIVRKELIEELYLASNQPIYWMNEKNTIALGNSLTKGIKENKKKVQAVYDYITKNISYDFKKINTIDDSYVPELDKILVTKQGICYDYSSLFAGILRSQGIPTKLVKGYKSDLGTYHAWNEVLIDGEWKVIDTTYDAALKDSKVKGNMIKSKAEYTNVRVY